MGFRRTVLALAALAVLWVPATAGAEIIHHEGMILADDGLPQEGDVSITLSIYDSEEGGEALWTELHEVDLVSGYYSLRLGLEEPLDGLFAEGERWLGIALDGGEELDPRQPLTAVPKAFVANNVIGDITPRSIRVGGRTLVAPDGSLAGMVEGIREHDGTGSGLDADRLDGMDSSEFVTSAEQILELLVGTDGRESGLDADRLDGIDSSRFMRTDQDTSTTGSMGIEGDLGVEGSLEVQGGVAVDGELTVGDGLEVDGDLAIGGDVGIDGDVGIGGDLSIDGSLNISGGMRAPNLDAPPDNPAVGAMYFDTESGGFLGFDGEQWVSLDDKRVGGSRRAVYMWSGGCSHHGRAGGWNRYCADRPNFHSAGEQLTVNGNGTFTARVAGMYRIAAWGISHGGSYPHIRLVVNGQYRHYGHEYGNGSWTDNFMDLYWRMNAGDSFYVDFYNRNYAYHSDNGRGAHSKLQVFYEGNQSDANPPKVWSGGCRNHGNSGGWNTYCANGQDFNTANEHLTVNSNGHFTARVAGFYRVNYWGIHLGSNWPHINLMVNGQYKHYGHDRGKGGWGDNFMDLTWPMNAGDTFYVRVHNPSRYAFHAWNSNGAHSRLQVSYEGGLAGTSDQLNMWSGGCSSHGTGGGWNTYCTNQQDFNTASEYLNVTGGGTFTARVAGYYRINAWAISHGGGWQHVNLMVNGSYQYYGHERGAGTWSDNFMDITWRMNAGDSFYVRYHNPGSYAFHSWNRNGAHSRLQVSFLGEL